MPWIELFKPLLKTSIALRMTPALIFVGASMLFIGWRRKAW
jgi:hypothetical protein